MEIKFDEWMNECDAIKQNESKVEKYDFFLGGGAFY